MTKPPSGVHLPNVSPRYRSKTFEKAAKLTQMRVSPGTTPNTPQNSGSDNAHFDSASHTSPQSVSISDRSHRRGVSRPRYWIAGSSVVAGLLLMADVSELRQPVAESPICQSVVQSEAFLSREALAALMAIPERDAKAAVQQVIGDPYCSLSPVEVRAGVQAERDAYPLAFDASAWVIVLYEGEEYAGYDFKFPQN